MKTLQVCMSITLMIILSSAVVAQTNARRPNSPQYDQVAAVFPGHRFALEIAVKPVKETVDGVERTVPTVFAFVTDAHFEPTRVETQAIRLNFVVDRRPRSFVLLPVNVDPRTENDPKPQSIFELKDPDLVKLISDGWQGNATAVMQVQVGRSMTPFTARLVRAKDIVPCVH